MIEKIQEIFSLPQDELIELVYSDKLADIIYPILLDPVSEEEPNLPDLFKAVVFCRDVGFSVEQSEKIAPWLLRFAQKYKNYKNDIYQEAVGIAIRTGASMLLPKTVSRLYSLLLPLLDPCENDSRAVLETVKMIGRIFEANAPKNIDQHPELSDKIYYIIECLLRPYAFRSSFNGSICMLCVYALAAMGSSKMVQVAELVKKFDMNWFIEYTHRGLLKIEIHWADRKSIASNQHIKLLYKTIKILES